LELEVEGSTTPDEVAITCGVSVAEVEVDLVELPAILEPVTEEEAAAPLVLVLVWVLVTDKDAPPTILELETD